MTDRRSAVTLALGVVALVIAGFAAGRARTIAGDAVPPPVVTVPLPAPIGHDGFWIGGWVGPPRNARDPREWYQHVAAGLDVSMGPLEDRYLRTDNLARLEFLDALRATDGPDRAPIVFVRDDSLHPDETTRPGWERRVEAIVAAYGRSPSLAGYFLADEPQPKDAPAWAPAARLLRRLDPAHPAYVNFLPIAPEDAAHPAARAHWGEQVAGAVRVGELAMFTFDAYPFPVDGPERPHFLATLREAARVSLETQRPFGAVLQWTGHGKLRAVSYVEALYQATQALAHGAAGITWFTYWTPNPAEEPWRWHDGAIAYDGSLTPRAGMFTSLNRRVRALAAARGPGPLRAVHTGGALPPGLDETFDASGAMPVDAPVASVTGGPATLGWTLLADPSGLRRYVLANRDRAVARTFTVTMKDGSAQSFTLPPGDAVVF